TTIEIGAHVDRIEPERLIEISNGTAVVALGGVSAAATDEAVRIRRLESDRPTEVRDGAIQVGIDSVRKTTVVVGGRTVLLGLGGALDDPGATSNRVFRIVSQAFTPIALIGGRRRYDRDQRND